MHTLVSQRVTGAPGGTAAGDQVAAVSRGTLAPDGNKGGAQSLTGLDVSLSLGNHPLEGSNDANPTLGVKCGRARCWVPPTHLIDTPQCLRGGARILCLGCRWGTQRGEGPPPSYQTAEAWCWNPGWPQN